MKRSYPFYIILLVVVLLSCMYLVKTRIDSETPETALSKAFASSKANIVSTEVYFWSTLDSRKFSSFDQLKELALDFFSELEVVYNNEFSSNVVNNDLIQEVELNGKLSNNRIVNIKVRLDKSDVNTGGRYISVDVVQDGSSLDLDKTRREVLSVFKRNKISPRVNSCITGNFEGKLDNGRLNDICKNVFREVGAKKVEGIRDVNLVSVSAYSPAIRNFIKVKGNKVNLNVAVRYNSYENRTYIWLATPVITTEY